MPSVAEKPLAFDTSLYKELPPDLREPVMVEDLAGFFLEAGAINLVERINPRELKIVNGQIFDPVRQEEVSKRWQGGSEVEDREVRGAERFYGYLLQNRVVVSVSSRGGISPYKETRINVAHQVDEDTIHFYGIPSNFNEADCWNLAWQLNEFSEGVFDPQNIDDLREIHIPVSIPEGMNNWDFLNQVTKLDGDAWNDIKAGNPWLRKDFARQKAIKVVNDTDQMIQAAKTRYDYVLAGAYMERSMQKLTGWNLSGWGCPGALNSQLLESYQNTENDFYQLDVFQNVRAAYSISTQDSDEKGSLKFKCPACGHLNTRPRGELLAECQNSECTNKDAVRC